MKKYEMYQFSCQIPGKSSLRIELWDYNMILSDKLIGYTQIDLEDRFFSPKYKQLTDVPIETRYNGSYRVHDY